MTPSRASSSWLPPKDSTKHSCAKSIEKLQLKPDASRSNLSSYQCKSKNKLPEVEIVQSHRDSEVNNKKNEHEIIFPDEIEGEKIENREIIVDSSVGMPKSVFDQKEIV